MDCASMQEILQPENNLEGVMVGRLAMNNTWEMAKIDNTFFPEFGHHDTLNRE